MLDVNEAVIHVDFSENYGCKNSLELQSAHFGSSNVQVTLHTGVMYNVDGLQSFAIISKSQRHDAVAVWAHLEPVLSYLRETNPEITDLHIFFDGPTTQYRNKQNMFLFCTLLHEMSFHSTTWNYFESSHRKGAPAANAIGRALKCKADDIVNANCDIPDADTLYNVLRKDSPVKIFSH